MRNKVKGADTWADSYGVDDVVGEQQRHFSGLNTRLLFTHVMSRLGDSAAHALLAGAHENRSLDVLLDDTSWSSYAQFRRLLEVAGPLLADVGGLEAVAEAHDVGTGSSPEIAWALLEFGSPVAMVLATADVGANIYPILSAEREVVGPTCLRWRLRLLDDFEPFPELCAFIKGLAPQIIRLFGLRVLDVLDTSCQCRGDLDCVIEANWDEAEDLAMQRDLMRTRLEIAENRLTALQETVSDIVSTDDLDAVLSRIVRSAARSMLAPGFILSLDEGPDGNRLYTDGVTIEEAERLLAANSDFLSAEIASTHRHYGRLLVVAPMRSVSHQQSSLDAYARLAATALDSAFALQRARRQAQTAEALLQLSTSLAELTSVDDLAAKVARAIPAVIDCDCSAVLLISEGLARVAAHHGYPPEGAADLENLAIPISQRDADRLSLRRDDDLPPFAKRLMDTAGLKAMAAAPLNVDGTTIGLLVAAVRNDSERILDDDRLADRFAGLAGQASVALRNSQLHHQIRHQSLHDPLTDLANRALILDRAGQILARGRRENTTPAALFIDLDGFKDINDTLGHEVGDQVLRQVAERLQVAMRANDTVGRLGGDEFVVLAEFAATDTDLEILAHRLLQSLREPFLVPGHERPLTIGASMGVALGDRSSADQLLRDADIALYSAKSAGKGCYRLFEADMYTEALARADLVERLSEAVVNEEFLLLYQPILDLCTGAVVGVEALLHWDRPDHGLVPPRGFVALLEQSGLIIEVGRWALRQACLQAVDLRASGHDISMSVNISAGQLGCPDVVDDVREALRVSGLAASSLILEITEAALVRDPSSIPSLLTELNALAVRLTIDNYGTGPSSVACLRGLPIDALKIDRNFLNAAIDSVAARDLLDGLVGLGRSMRLTMIANGVELIEQRQRLRQAGCDRGQGSLFAAPLSAAGLVAFLDGQAQPVSCLPATTA